MVQGVGWEKAGLGSCQCVWGEKNMSIYTPCQFQGFQALRWQRTIWKVWFNVTVVSEAMNTGQYKLIAKYQKYFPAP